VVNIQRLVKNGNSTQVVIPRGYMRALGWNSGEQIAIELVEDGTVWIRRPTVRDLRNAGSRIVNLPPVKAATK